MTAPAPPDGYQALRVGRAEAVARADVASAIAQVLAIDSPERWAAAQPERRPLQGRGIAWAVRLPDGTPVVVRHSRHGGVLAPLTGDRFLAPTRAPEELRTALRLAGAGVRTPAILAYVLFPAGPLLRRADVVMAEIEGGMDLPTAIATDPGTASLLQPAVGHLLAALTRAGARHPDLNLKNVLVTLPAAGPPTAWVLDVDRVLFERPGDPRVTEANLARLGRSVRKWRERRGLPLPEHWMQGVATGVAAERGRTS